MRWRRAWRWCAGAAVLAGVLRWTGARPFLSALAALDPATLLLGAALAVLTTVACAWRWRLVAEGLGVGPTNNELDRDHPGDSAKGKVTLVVLAALVGLFIVLAIVGRIIGFF